MDARAGRDVATIAAIASPGGSGARGVIRISGPNARDIVRATWGSERSPDLDRRAVLVGRFDDGRGTQPLMLLWMPAPHSFTREDVAELHLPGSPPLLSAALAAVLRAGAVAAEPGEFTRRAFHSGRIDLTRAEGVLALVEASSEAQARAARSLLFGGLADRVAAARDALVDLRTLCEASLDFGQDDAGHVGDPELAKMFERARCALDDALGFEVQRTHGSGTPRVALAGAPNAGKSALFNALTGVEGAIVSDQAGTTRDALEARIDVGGVEVRLLDAAGMDPEAARGVDAEAQERSRSAREEAEVVVWVVDGSRAEKGAVDRERRLLPERPVCLAWNKTDLAPDSRAPAWTADLGAQAVVPVSARTGSGLESLRAAIAMSLEGGVEGGVERETALRHKVALDEARRELEEGVTALRSGRPLELVAEHLRRGTDALDAVSGATTSEDVLDRIFGRFCLGK